MTETGKKAAVREDMRLARSALAEARLLADHDQRPGALNRAYYAAHHAARALLASRGVEVRSHAGLKTELGRHFVKPGLLPAAAAKTLRSLSAEREEADYGRFMVVEREQVEEAVRDADSFVSEAEALLRQGGWDSDEDAG